MKICSFNFASAMAIFPFILLNNKTLKQNKVLINHEKIHLRQQLELLIVFFYIWYFTEYFIHFIRFKNRRKAYMNISFEKEAYYFEKDLNYIEKRNFFSFLKFLN